MSPEIIKFIIEQGIEQGPKIGRAIQKLFETKTLTQTDWDSFFSAIEEKSYEDYTKPKNAGGAIG